MQNSMAWRTIRLASPAVMLFAAALVLWQGNARGQAAAQTPAKGPQITQTVVLDNEKFNVRRLTFPPGFRQTLHTDAANRDELVILITPAQFEGQVDDKK